MAMENSTYSNMGLLWSQVIFVGATAVSLPLYLLIITACVKEWKYNHALRTFYLLIISQGVVDIIVMVSYFMFWSLRTFGVFSDFFWEYQHYYLASWCFTQTYISVIIRCFGILLISLQRYLSMCKNGKQIEQLVNISHRWMLPILHWVIPTLYSIPLLAVKNVTFLSKENLQVIADKHDITVSMPHVTASI
ncbi:hypothetical protein ANCCAN_28190 [Ancylostoma caninum]|uniref:G-protein coupled receptors family 1 profile domain-containing protein n=1 Tax=Ancylostoma caninum TaxID=29170 RepID=A0A368F524_ANCCA|nr:hypothetical protein ANCCAN_28190 [Ancylostoma caninum]